MFKNLVSKRITRWVLFVISMAIVTALMVYSADDTSSEPMTVYHNIPVSSRLSTDTTTPQRIWPATSYDWSIVASLFVVLCVLPLFFLIIIPLWFAIPVRFGMGTLEYLGKSKTEISSPPEDENI